MKYSVKLSKTKGPKGSGVKPLAKGLSGVITGINRDSNPFSGTAKKKKGLKFSQIMRGLKL